VSWVLSTAEVDEVVVVPVLEHAFAKPLSPYPHRFRMAELAFGELRRVRVSDIEARLGGASYTVHTLEEIARRAPGVSLRVVIGSDLVDEVPRWKEGARVPKLAPLLIIGRGGYEDGTRELHLPVISSTEIRERLQNGVSVDGLVPRSVVRYIDRYGLYR
jgi:nicotinate-nucleotide adenylyltransferase